MRKAQIAALTVATLAVASAYYGLADSLDLVPGPLSAASSSYRPQPYPTPSPPAEESGTPSGLDPDAPAPTAAALNSMASTLSSDPMVGKGTTATTVIDVSTGETLLDVNGGSALTPASSNKVLTAWAALSVLGPDHTLTTKAVVSGGTVTLVGGGDVLLAADAGDPSATVGHAGLGDLARSTAEALKDKGVTSVSVALDDTLFTGPSWNSSWEDGNQAWVAPIQPIMLDVTAHSHSGAYPSDPAMDAAKAFSDQLTAAGVAVTGDVTRGAASSDAAELASVESAPLADVLSVSLKTSDNTMTEVEGRLVAIGAHREATFEGATAAVLAQLGTDGFDTTGVTMLDCSGLALGDKVSSRLLAQIIARSAGADGGTVRRADAAHRPARGGAGRHAGGSVRGSRGRGDRARQDRVPGHHRILDGDGRDQGRAAAGLRGDRRRLRGRWSDLGAHGDRQRLRDSTGRLRLQRLRRPSRDSRAETAETADIAEAAEMVTG